MSLTKIVDGKRVDMPSDQEEKILSEWNAPPTTAEWHDMIAAARYNHEIAGTTFTHSNGDTYSVYTDRQSQAMVAGTRLSLEDVPDLTVDWKTGQGFVAVGETDIKAIATAVRQHVESCFSRERDLLQKVEDGTIEELDLDDGWPGS